MTSIRLPRLIGITGLAGSGKDTLADHLVSTHGYTKRSLAAPLKELLNSRFGWTMEQWANREWKEKPALADLYSIDWDRHCPHPATTFSPRQLAQWLGTECFRDIAGPDVWIDMLLRDRPIYCEAGDYYNSPLVIPDVRFDNEAYAIREEGGIILKVVRPQVDAVAAHVSEEGVNGNLVHLAVLNDEGITTFIAAAMQGLYSLN